MGKDKFFKNLLKISFPFVFIHSLINRIKKRIINSVIDERSLKNLKLKKYTDYLSYVL